MQAKHLDDADFLLRIAHHSGDPYEAMPLFGLPGGPSHGTRWTLWHELCEWYPEAPPKVVLAKAKALIRRKLLTGCTCGCRGDFEITKAGADWLACYLATEGGET